MLGILKALPKKILSAARKTVNDATNQPSKPSPPNEHEAVAVLPRFHVIPRDSRNARPAILEFVYCFPVSELHGKTKAWSISPVFKAR